MEDFATGYALGADDRRDGYGDGMMGGQWMWIIVVFALLFGWGRNGLGGAGADGSGALTRSDLCEGFNFNDLQNGVRGLSNGLCDGFYAVNTSLLNGFGGVNNAICASTTAINGNITQSRFDAQQCCCETQRLLERGFCDTQNLMSRGFCDVIQSSHNDTDRVLCKLNEMESTRQQEKIEALRLENQTLKFQASQSGQNALLIANNEAQTAELIRRCCPAPVPAYTVPAPYPYSVGYSMGYGGWGRDGFRDGCGCGFRDGRDGCCC